MIDNVEKTIPSEDIELAWLAGIIDGEGSVGVYKTTQGTNIINISIVNSDEKILTKVEEILKRINVFYCKYEHNNKKPKGYSKTKPCYVITVRRKDEALFLAEIIEPFLVGAKKESILKMIVFLKNNPKVIYHKKYICIFCNKGYSGRKRKYCTLSCWHIFATGKNNPNHKNGKYIACND